MLGRATFPDADLWSCACAIQNLWLAARAEGLGMGWVTLFRPDALGELLGLPDGVVTLGWLCLGWPDERPPAPGLERAGWSTRLPLEAVVLHDRWSESAAPPSHLRAPEPEQVVAARDEADRLLTPPGSLGILDRAVDRAVTLGHEAATTGTLVLTIGRHPVTNLGVSAFASTVTDDVAAAAAEGTALGVVAARAAGLRWTVLDGGSSTGDLLHADALTPEAAADLLERGRAAAPEGIVVLGEVGIGNTTVAAALTSALLGLPVSQTVGLGSGADSTMLARKREVVSGALARVGPIDSPLQALAALGGPEAVLLAGVVLGATAKGSLVILDGLLTSIAALAAVRLEPAVAQHLVAGQRSRERAHGLVLEQLGLEPLLDLRLRAGEGAGGCFAAGMLLSALEVRRSTARTR